MRPLREALPRCATAPGVCRAHGSVTARLLADQHKSLRNHHRRCAARNEAGTARVGNPAAYRCDRGAAFSSCSAGIYGPGSLGSRFSGGQFWSLTLAPSGPTAHLSVCCSAQTPPLHRQHGCGCSVRQENCRPCSLVNSESGRARALCPVWKPPPSFGRPKAGA